MVKIIGHIDLNAFFASAEVIRDPSLKGKPIIVGGDGPRSVVSTCSYEARKYGVHSAMPIYQAKKLCPNGVYKEPDFRYYEMLSRSFFAYLRRFSLVIEKASIDEGYIDLTSQLTDYPDPIGYLKGIQSNLLKEIGLPCSIGLSTTKFLAKMASDMKKPLGITIIRKSDIQSTIYPFAIESFYGIGKKSSEKLRRIGISTIGGLANMIKTNEGALLSIFGQASLDEIKKDLNGTSSNKVEMEEPTAKSIGRSETFLQDTDSLDEINEILKKESEEIASDLKKSKLFAGTITIQHKDPSFKNKTRSKKLDDHIQEADDIYKEASSLYEREFKGQIARLVGVSVSSLIDESHANRQMTLWDYDDYKEENKTSEIIEKINEKLDKKALMIASEKGKYGDK